MDGERRKRKDSCLPSTFILPRLLWICLPSALHVLPSLPRFSQHPVYFQGLLPCVCFPYLSLPPSLSISPSLLLIFSNHARRSRGRGEEGWREGQVVRMREGRKRTTEQRNKRDRWSFLLPWVSLTSLQPSVGCASPLPRPRGCSAALCVFVRVCA